MTTPRTQFALPLLLAGLVAACAPGQEAPPETPGAAAQGAAATAVGGDAVPVPPSPTAAPPATTREAPQVMEGIPSPIAMPPKGTETPAIAAGAEVTYVCENGMPLRVSFDGTLAHVAWTDGRRITLSITANQDGGGERYAGGGFELRRVGNVVELAQDGGGPQWRCAEGSATA